MDKTKDFIGFLDKMQGLLKNAKEQGHIIVRIEDIENTFPELKRDKEREFNGVIVEEDFNEGDGFYKMSLAYLSTEQVEEIEGLVGSWNHNEKQDQVKESTEIQHDNKTCKENDDSLTSEDERIGKDIVSFLRSKNGYMTPNEDWDFHNRWLPWLEKQGIKPQGKPALEAAKEAGLLKKEAEYPSFDEAQGTPVITIDTYCKEHCKGYQETGKCYADGNCDAKIKAEQNSSWTEEDERNLQNIDSVLFRETSLSEDECMRLRDWLQSLKERVVWKPSEEQIKAIRIARSFVVDDFGEHPATSEILIELEKQLKKL